MVSGSATNNITKTAEKHALKRKLGAKPPQTFTSRLNEKYARNEADSDDFDDPPQSGNEGSGNDGDFSDDEKPPVKKSAKAAQRPAGPVAIKRDRAVRSQDRANKPEKNWTTAMKRHW